MTTKRAPKKKRPTLTPEERQARVDALHEKLGEAVAAITTDESWQAMLDLAAKFHNYSANNLLLLWIQAEERGITLTRVAGAGTWRKLGRWITKDQKGLQVFAPNRYRMSQAEAEAKGPHGFDAEGKPKFVIRGFRVEHVFDVSQTEGEPLPEGPAPQLLAGDGPAGLFDEVRRLVEAEGYQVRLEAPSGGANGQVDYLERVVRVRPDVDDAQACKTLIHELAHILADHEHRDIPRRQREAEAESAAYIVAQLAGLDTVQYSAPYVAGWSGGNPAVIEAAMAAVKEAARVIVERLEKAVEVAAS